MKIRLLLSWLVLSMILCSLPSSAAAAAPAKHINWNGKRWFLTGANLPYVSWRCDFGCRSNGGVSGREAVLDERFKRLSRKGVKVVRWYLFPGDAWQISRTGGGAPNRLQSKKVFPDVDTAVRLAHKHDIALVFVLFSDTRTIPATWISDPAQRTALATALDPLFRRYRASRTILAWDLFHEPERGIDDASIATADIQALVQLLATHAHARSRARVTVGSVGVDRLDTWTSLGLDYYSAHWFSSSLAGSSCAGCTTPSALATSEGISKPVVVSAFDGARASTASARLRRLRSRGYAGALMWSVHKRAHPDIPGGAKPGVPLSALWRFLYRFPSAGPRSRPLNPCLGPEAHRYLCPDLRMSRPANLFLGRRNGRTVLFSRNSINSYGDGPAQLFGRRNGRYTMAAVQKLHRRSGGTQTIRTGAKLLFKAIPGQYRYWKWNGAARMELWQLDGAGHWVRRIRLGPKTVYCLRDLKRTRSSLPRSPAREHFPGCNQRASTRQVTLGTSVGWSDIYPSTYHENWVDVTRLRGCFAYVHIGDPTNVIYESNEDNNRSSVTVRLPYTGSNAGCPHAKPAPTISAGSGY